MSGAGPEIRVYVGVGSNIEPEKNLRLACRELRARFGELDVSPVYRTAAVGFDGDDFLNMVVAFITGQTPRNITDVLETIHDLAGRKKTSNRFSSRTLDIDLLLYGDHVIDEPGIEVPRSDITEYGFVLGPLVDLAPNLMHPVTGQTMGEIWKDFDEEQQRLELTDFSPLTAAAD